MKEISIHEIGPVGIGQVEDAAAGTGCTVIVAKDGMRAGLDVRGGGPASRETQLLNPLMAAQVIHAVVLGGGSAFGLGAANGVMACLEERGIGLPVGVTQVPLVVQSDIFDLSVGDPFTRPDPAMGYEAARRALEAPNYQDGNYGAGCGATVGKICGMGRAVKTGIGSFAVQVGELKVGAISVVNAVGDIFDWKSGKQIAGPLSEDGSAFLRTAEIMKERYAAGPARDAAAGQKAEEPAGQNTEEPAGGQDDGQMPANTTISIVLTNAYFRKAELCKIAGMAHDGYARSIHPVHTSMDGDSIYAASIGDVQADQDLVGTIAAEVISEAILRAVTSAESAYGIHAVKDL